MILEKALDKTEFLSIYGICSLSLYHTDNSYKMEVNGQTFSVDYWPGNSKSGMFGGSSNWRGLICGQGLGASHQTGWTGLVAWMIFQSGSTARLPRRPRRPRSSADHYFAESPPLTTTESVSSTDNGGHCGK
ncbi:hypothetical protein BY996DRAFT_8549348 [Phakopsora pachyrhizi]|nr:hypothetical protein BY996DRAFT_8549348 [Phakopsora pachyrhizi]